MTSYAQFAIANVKYSAIFNSAIVNANIKCVLSSVALRHVGAVSYTHLIKLLISCYEKQTHFLIAKSDQILKTNFMRCV